MPKKIDAALAEAVAKKVGVGRGDRASLAGPGRHQRRSPPGGTSSDQAEIRQLKAEIRRLGEDNEILRQWTTYCS